MSGTLWRQKFFAAFIHMLATAALAGIAAVIIFYVWFPQGLSGVVGGTELFLIVVGCDLALGPLMSLVIYDPKKTRRKLIIDYSIVGLVQVIALCYGVWVVSASRPVFVAYDVRRLEIVAALDIEDDALKEAPREFASRSWTGPKLIAIARPTDQREKNDLMFKEIMGAGAYLVPKYYSDFASQRAELLANAQPIDHLLKDSGEQEARIRAALAKTGRNHDELRWILAHHRFGFAVALIDSKSGEPVQFVPVNPLWVKD